MPGNTARWDRPVRFVNGVDIPIEPVIDGLTRGTNERSGEHNATKYVWPSLKHRQPG